MTTIFYATQRSNIRTMLKPFETMLQQCGNDVLQIVPCNITLKEVFCKGKGAKEWIRVYPACAFAFILLHFLEFLATNTTVRASTRSYGGCSHPVDVTRITLVILIRSEKARGYLFLVLLQAQHHSYPLWA